MRLASYLRYLYLAYFSKPASERILYRAIRRTRARKILEIGIGDIGRTLRMIRLAHRFAQDEPVRYAAIDLFEARPAADRPTLSLKEAHQRLKPTSAQIQLLPGDPAGALARSANSLPNVDLVLISSRESEAALLPAWFYFPRMLHDGSVVYRQTVADDGTPAWVAVEAETIAKRAAAGRRRAA